MKTKHFALLIACVLCSTIVLFLYGNPSVQPSIQSLVSDTHLQFENWKRFRVKQEIKAPDVEEKYLKQLGFHVDEPRLYPKNKWLNVTLPVFMTGVVPSEGHLILRFLKSFQHFFPEYFLIIYDLGLNPSVINGICNSSSCTVRTFDFNAYPSHIKNLQLFAYRPIIIQEVLNQAGAVIMMDVQYVINTGEIQSILNQAEKEGLSSWTVDLPTSALTHPHMFDYFNTKPEKFFFHRMIEPNHIVLYNTVSIHFGVMFPWVKCALIQNCIAPIGAQNSGCRYDKKPLYRYSGCHRYDTSAINVILGLLFNFSCSRFAAREEDKFFLIVDTDKEVILDFEKNSTIFSNSI